jgi:hypothetical protein
MAQRKGAPKPPGSGKPKGYKAPATLAKEAAREAVRVRITQRIFPIIDAQIDSAVGISHFMLRDKTTGQWERLTDPDQIVAALNDPKAKFGSTFLIYTKDPNSNAARDMLAYAVDKPKEQAQDLNLGLNAEAEAMIKTLLDGRARAAKRGK